MATAKKKLAIVLSPSRDIPFNQLVLSQSNVRRIKAGVSVEELAEDIARRGILQGLTVRPVVDAAGAETGMFEIPAGGRRFRALELLLKQKRLAKIAPIPCVVREGGIAEEDSLAENVQRAPLHPLDQFRAFLALREKGQSEEEIAATFFISVNVVKQRLKLASVSPVLLDIYAEDGMTLAQLEAFTVEPLMSALADFGNSRVRAREVTDFPEPLSPTTPTVLPRATSNETPETTVASERPCPNLMVRSRTDSRGPSPCPPRSSFFAPPVNSMSYPVSLKPHVRTFFEVFLILFCHD